MTGSRKEFHRMVEEALADQDLQDALDQNSRKRKRGWESAFKSLPSDVESIKEKLQSIRIAVINDLPNYLARFEKSLKNNGFIVHYAVDADSARNITAEIISQNNAKRLVKSKSMVTEEIDLNHYLEEAGCEIIETDLGEFIVQLRNEKPSHIITPAVHLKRDQVAELFHNNLGTELPADIKELTNSARRFLREKFLNADIGISGVNFGIAETGHICIVTNEGNGRLVTSLPKVHIAIMGIEKIVPTFDDLYYHLLMLARSATGQKLTSYVNFIRSPQNPDGSQETFQRHIVLLDNGRMEISKSSYSQMLTCIRCGACLNICPVFQEIGGHSYGSIYPGPIGSILSPRYFGLAEFGHLSRASTLCGACKDVCPVIIDIPSLLVRTRDEYSKGAGEKTVTSIFIKLFSWISNYPSLYQLGQSLLSKLIGAKKWISSLPWIGKRWTESRHFPAFAKNSFRKRWGKINQQPDGRVIINEQIESSIPSERSDQSEELESLEDIFIKELKMVDGTARVVSRNNLVDEIINDLIQIPRLSLETIIGIDSSISIYDDNQFIEQIKQQGWNTLEFPIQNIHSFGEPPIALGSCQIGITNCIGGIADTGTIVLDSDNYSANILSMLSDIHIVLLEKNTIYPDLQSWLENPACLNKNFTLITGPSRTADIEMTLTVGVHGPEKLLVYIIQD